MAIGTIAGSARQFAPLTIALSWWTLCLFLYLVGWPIAYDRTNALLAASLFGMCGVMMAIGFRASFGPAPGVVSLRTRFPTPVVIGVTASLLLVPAVASAYSGFSVNELSLALADQGAAFEQGTQRIVEGQSERRGLLAVQALLAPFTLIALPVTALYWFEQRRGLLLFLAAVAVPIVTSILVGRDQQLGWSAIIVGAVWVLSRYRRGLGIRGRSLATLAALAGALGLAFAARKASRGGPSYFCPPGSRDCLFVDAPPTLVESALAYVSSYASHGFEGLGRALETHWTFGGGLSHAPALAAIAYDLLGIVTPHTVSSQLGDVGWSATWYWSTALTTIANDVPWVLIPLVLMVQGVILARSWRRSLVHGDSLSVGVFALTWLGILFVPQNLQLVASGPTYVGYLVLLAAFVLRGALEQVRRRRNERPSLTPRVASAPALHDRR